MQTLSDPANDSLRIDTALVRTVAIMAIVNSHLEHYYPRPEFAVGGLIGLALFFLVAGMGLNHSQHTRRLSFFHWYGRRIERIHPSVIVSALLIQLLLLCEWKSWRPIDYIDRMIFPISDYHFLTKIYVFYAPLYFFIRWRWRHKHALALSACGLLCVATAIPDIRYQWNHDEPLATGKLSPLFLWSVFFSMTLIGVWMSDRPDFFRRRSLRRTGVFVVTAAVFYFTTKYAMAKEGIFTEGFLLLFAFGLLTAILLVVFLSDQRLVDYCRHSNRVLNWTAVGLGTISLEIYLVHAPLSGRQVGMQLRFPANLVLYLAASLALSMVVYFFAGLLRRMISQGHNGGSR